MPAACHLQKTALTEHMKERRPKWAITLLKTERCTAAWIYRHVIWVDVCNSVLPLSATKAAEQALARKGKRGWVSDASRPEAFGDARRSKREEVTRGRRSGSQPQARGAS